LFLNLSTQIIGEAKKRTDNTEVLPVLSKKVRSNS
jgi:hypothetical protein